jgi:hypothetical protein
MAYHTKSPIVTDGLVFSIDAYNTKSYVSGDTTTYDLTINGNNGSLTNVTFTDKYWGFNGLAGVSGSIIDVGQPSILDNTSRTISAWFYPTSNNRAIYTRGDSRGNSATRDIDIYGNSSLLVSMATNTASSTNFSLNTPFPTFNQWHEVTTTWDGTTSVDSAKLYLNGILVDSATPLAVTQHERFNHYIGGYDGAGPGNYNWDGDISIFKIYNRPLTADEVLQNYNALKYRFV